MKVAIYARCSTEESKQDVKSQVDTCAKYCEAQGWGYEVFKEFESAYNGKRREVFENLLERLRLKEYHTLMVYMLDRFSRATPTKIVADLHRIVGDHKCRFISLKEGIDSDNEMWQIVMMVFAYMANSYSKMLGIRVKEGIRAKKEKGKYNGGRPRKKIDLSELQRIYKETNSLRQTVRLYNEEKESKERVSLGTVQKTLFDSSPEARV